MAAPLAPLCPGFARFLAAAVVMLAAPRANAFCGFYVGKADANLFNDASQVVMVRDGERTTTCRPT